MPRFLILGEDEAVLGLFTGMASDLGHASVSEVLRDVTPEEVEACEYVVFLPAKPKAKAKRSKKDSNKGPEPEAVVFKRQQGGFNAVTSQSPPSPTSAVTSNDQPKDALPRAV